MSMSVEFQFQTSHTEDWTQILEGLGRGETGALFQDRMDVFGEAVADQLEEMLERWPAEYFLIEGYHQDGDHFRVEFVAGPDAGAFAQEMGGLLEACRVKGLKCRGVDLSGD